MTRLESEFQSRLINRLRVLIGKDGFVIKTDPNYIQGFPDILILYRSRWAALECKRSINEKEQPNQRYYINLIDTVMTYATFVSPENEEEVIYDLQQALRIR